MERADFELWKARDVARLLALVEGERRFFQRIVSLLPIPLAVLSGERSIVSANRAFRHIFDLRPEELRDKPIDRILASPHLIEAIRDSHMRSVEPVHASIEVNGRPMRATILPIRNLDEDSDYETLLILEDVPASSSAVAAPAPASGNFPCILWQADPRTLAFTSVAGSAERLLGFPASHWLSAPRFFRERIHPGDRAATLALYEAAIARGGDAGAEFRSLSASGAAVWCHETIRVAPNGSLSGVMVEITRRKQLESQMTVSERAGAVRELAARLAHDLNNPLMIVNGYGEEVLQSIPAQDPRRRDMEQVLAAAERVSAIANQLVGYTRKLANPPQPVELTALLGHLGAVAAVETPPGSIWALADPEQLESALRDLAAGENPVGISCSVEIVAERIPGAPLEPGAYAAISIRGRSPNPRSFEAALPKSPAEAAAARAYALVREWGGSIVSTPDSFIIYLKSTGAASEPRASQAGPALARTSDAPPAILVVDDEAEIRALMKKILTRERYSVLEAGSAEEAINLFSRAPKIDLLLTDVILPGVGGRELAEKARQLLPDLKVIYVSGYTGDESVRSGNAPPGSKFLQKPFTLAALLETVRQALLK